MPKHQTIAILWLVTLLTAMPASAASIYRIKADIAKGTVLTADHLVEVPMSKSKSYLIDVFQQSLLHAYVTDRRLKRYLGRAIPHDLPESGYLMRNDFTLFGSIENVPLAKNPPRDFRPLLETDYQTIDDDSIAWIDNVRLLFVGLDPEDPTRDSQHGIGKKHLYEWNTRTGEVSIYRRDVIGKLCVAEEWIEIQIEHPTVRLMYEAGTYGSGQQIPGKELHYWDVKRPFHHGSECSRRMPDEAYVPIPEAFPAPLVYPLREEDGYLVIPRYKQKNRINSLLYQRPGQPAIDLGFNPIEVRTREVRYLPFADRYFLDNTRRRTSDIDYTRSNCATSWWMDPDGTLEPVCIAWGPWLYIEPFRDGFVLASDSIRNPSDGIHLQQNSRLVQLFNGMITDLAVSPSGCRLAFVTRTVKVAPDRRSSEIGPWLPKVVELCDGTPI